MVNKIPTTYECPADVLLLNFIDTHLEFYRWLRLTPNIITTIGLATGILCAYNIFNGNFKIAAILFLIAYYFDCVDGKLARKYNMQTRFGDYYDHFSDVFKIIIILYALYATNDTKYNDCKWIIYVLIILCTLHLGYQEVIYNSNESPTLEAFRTIAKYDTDPTRTIKITRFVGCGTLILVIFIYIFTWEFPLQNITLES